MTENWASIDIGTHTARLLVARKSKAPGRLKPLARKRAYIRLGGGFSYSEGKTIQPEAIGRTLEVLGDFLQCTRLFDVHEVHAVATGVVREATNRDEFLDLIYEHTGIRVRPIAGEEEALLTGKGVMHAFNVQPGPFLVFDLGGGSTEFLLRTKGSQVVRSTPIGSTILKQAFLKSDPPKDKQVDALSRHIDKLLEEARLEPIGGRDGCLIVGTGGTVTTLAAMLFGIPLEEITPDRINGLTLKVKQLEELFDEIKRLPYEERLRLPGLDPDRADVILAGCLAAIRILYFFKSLQLSVSLSDLLEGILIDYAEGDKNG